MGEESNSLADWEELGRVNEDVGGRFSVFISPRSRKRKILESKRNSMKRRGRVKRARPTARDNLSCRSYPSKYLSRQSFGHYGFAISISLTRLLDQRLGPKVLVSASSSVSLVLWWA